MLLLITLLKTDTLNLWQKIFDALKIVDTGSGVGDDIVSAVLITVISFVIVNVAELITQYWRSSAKVYLFREEEIKKATKFFVPNNVKIYNSENRLIHLHIKDKENSVIALINHVRSTQCQTFFFLIAPTGVGKSTFLLNMYQYYRKKSRRSFMPPLLLGHMHDDRFTEKALDDLLKEEKTNWFVRLKHKVIKKHKAIILLDGMDEFANHDYGSQEQFWNEFNIRWDLLRNKLKNAGRVIIAVREQFAIQYLNVDVLGIRSTFINKQNLWKIQLELFAENQIDDYLNIRFMQSEEFARIKKTKELFKEKGVIDLLKNPLILSYIEDLSEENVLKATIKRQQLVNEETQNFKSVIINRFDIYTVIVEKWLEREKTTFFPDVSPTDQQLKLVIEFCEELAFKMVTSTNKFDVIEEDEFTEFEKSFFTTSKSFIKHFSDRSLLIKDKEMFESSNVRFIHPIFLNYFLASYALSRLTKIRNALTEEILHTLKKQQESIDIILLNPLYSVAVDMLLAWEWYSLKNKKELLPAVHLHRRVDLFKEELNMPEWEVLKKWLDYIENITPYEAVKKHLENGIDKVLSTVDITWKDQFKPLEELCIGNDGFLENNIVLKDSQKLIKYVNFFITKILLRNVSVKNKDLKCFENAQNIQHLEFEKLEISGQCFDYFKKSIKTITNLVLINNNLLDEDLLSFKGITHLKALQLTNNNFTEKCMKIFSNSNFSLTSLQFEFNNNALNNINFIEDFIRNKQYWKKFGISNIQLNLLKPFLFFYKNTLDDLRLCNANIDDEDLSFFKSFTILETLQLTSNRITGKTFNHFESFKKTLERILISDNPLEQNSLEILLDYPKLKELYISNCPKQNEDILNRLREKGVRVFE